MSGNTSQKTSEQESEIIFIEHSIFCIALLLLQEIKIFA